MLVSTRHIIVKITEKISLSIWVRCASYSQFYPICITFWSLNHKTVKEVDGKSMESSRNEEIKSSVYSLYAIDYHCQCQGKYIHKHDFAALGVFSLQLFRICLKNFFFVVFFCVYVLFVLLGVIMKFLLDFDSVLYFSEWRGIIDEHC